MKVVDDHFGLVKRLVFFNLGMVILCSNHTLNSVIAWQELDENQQLLEITAPSTFAMKILLVLLFVGVAYATSPDALKKASDEVLESFLHGMSHAPALHEALGIPNTEEVQRFERDLKEELENHLREAFEKALKKIEDAYIAGKPIHKGALEKLRELKNKMKDLKIGDDEVTKDLLEVLKEKVNQNLKELLEKFGIVEKPSLHLSNEPDEPVTNIFEDFNIRNFIIRLKETILEKMDVESLKKSLAKVVGQGAQRLCEWLTSQGKEKVMGFIDRVLEKDEDKKKRSVSDLSEQIKQYFKDLDLDFKQKFSKFGEWLREVLENGLDKSKSKIEKVTAISKQLIDKSKVISKEVAEQALDYLRDYKEELGELYEKVYGKLMEKIMDYTD